jgi:hypothetical protein
MRADIASLTAYVRMLVGGTGRMPCIDMQEPEDMQAE